VLVPDAVSDASNDDDNDEHVVNDPSDLQIDDEPATDAEPTEGAVIDELEEYEIEQEDDDKTKTCCCLPIMATVGALYRKWKIVMWYSWEHKCD